MFECLFYNGSGFRAKRRELLGKFFLVRHVAIVVLVVNSEEPQRSKRIEMIASVQHRRHWTTEEYLRLDEEMHLLSQSVSFAVAMG